MTPELADEYSRAVFDQPFAGICQTDRIGRIIRVNDRYCEIVERTRAELLRTRLQNVAIEDGAPTNWTLYERLVSHHEPFTIESRRVRRDGTVMWVQKNLSPIIGAAGLIGVTTIVFDISARKHLEEVARSDADRFRVVAESVPQKLFTAKPN